MNEFYEQLDNYFSVSFRVAGSGLEPSRITELLGVKPDIEHKKGEPRILKYKNGTSKEYAPWDRGLWCLESKIDKYCKLKDHIENVLSFIETKRESLLYLRGIGMVMDLYCGYFISPASQAGISLPCDVLKRVSELGIDVCIELYVI